MWLYSLKERVEYRNITIKQKQAKHRGTSNHGYMHKKDRQRKMWQWARKRKIWKVIAIMDDEGHINERKIKRAPINIQAAIRAQLQECIDKQRGKKRKRNREEEEEKGEEPLTRGILKEDRNIRNYIQQGPDREIIIVPDGSVKEPQIRGTWAWSTVRRTLGKLELNGIGAVGCENTTNFRTDAAGRTSPNH